MLINYLRSAKEAAVQDWVASNTLHTYFLAKKTDLSIRVLQTCQQILIALLVFVIMYSTFRIMIKLGIAQG